MPTCGTEVSFLNRFTLRSEWESFQSSLLVNIYLYLNKVLKTGLSTCLVCGINFAVRAAQTVLRSDRLHR